MKIAITGGSGFIGRHLIESLSASGHSINALSRRKMSSENKMLSWHQGDLSDDDVLTKLVSECDVVCNCAGETTNPDMYTQVNYEGTKSLYKACSTEGVTKYIQLSSTGVYGRRKNGIIDERSDLLPVNDYEESKTIADTWLLKQSGPKVTILRPTNVYGKDMPNNSLRQLVSALERGMFFFIGGHDAITSYVHVDNVVNAILNVTESKTVINTNEAYNISDDVLLEDFVFMMSSAIAKGRPRIRLPRLPVVLLLFFVEKVIPIKLPLTLSRIHFLTKTSTYSVEKFMNRFCWVHTSHHNEALLECVKFWRNDISKTK